MDPRAQVLLYFGGAKAADDLKRGDILISPDARTKVITRKENVQSEENYVIYPETSEPLTVSGNCILTLMNKQTNERVDISAKECFAQSARYYTLYSVPVKYAESPTRNDPYLIGMIIGGNVSTKSFHSVIKDYLMKRLDNIQRGVIETRSKNDLSQMNQDEIRDLLTNRFISDEYLYNSEQVRMKLLRGVLSPMISPANSRSRSRSISPTRDARRGLVRSKSVSRIRAVSTRSSRIPVLKKNMTTITIYDQNLCNQVVFLAKSLGYAVIQDDGEITIFGNIGASNMNACPVQVPFKIKKLMNAPACSLTRLTFDANTQDNRVILASCVVFNL